LVNFYQTTRRYNPEDSHLLNTLHASNEIHRLETDLFLIKYLWYTASEKQTCPAISYSRKMRWAGHVARMGEMRNAYKILLGKPEGKRLLGRPGRRRGDNRLLESIIENFG
jgi:hypothetical protein